MLFLGGFGETSVTKSKIIFEQNQQILNKHYDNCHYITYPESFAQRQKALGDNYSEENENLLNQELAQQLFDEEEFNLLDPFSYDIIAKCSGGGITFQLLSLLKNNPPKNVFLCVPSIPIKNINAFFSFQSNILFFWNRGDEKLLFFGNSSVQQEKVIFQNEIIPLFNENYAFDVLSYVIDIDTHDVSDMMFNILHEYLSK